MAIEVTMPKFGLTMHEGTVQRFFTAVGKPVRAGEALYEVETEKVLYEVEAPGSGTLAIRLSEDGETVECGAVVAVIAEQGEDAVAVAARYPGNAGTVATGGIASGNRACGNPRRPVSPVARKLAAELGVELAAIVGTGPGGRVTREDVERAAAAAGPRGAVDSAARASSSVIPLRAMRRTIAERMHRSLQQSAQITITMEADITEAVGLRARLQREFNFTYTDLVIHAAARALARHPRMNSRIAEREIELLGRINVGVAVSLDDGLIVPVVFDADRKSLSEIAAATAALAERARAGRLTLEEVTGGTFTVSNLGVWGVDAFTPILNPGETGILGVGRIVEKPAIHEGEISRRSMMTLSLTFDHRVMDGAPAAAFLHDVIELLNHPESMK
jgi:pyruvate dehydrogenase E2 component (dihydrolipoamide acetyltransferase)